MDITNRTSIVLMKLFFECRKVTLVLIVIKMVFALKMFDKVSNTRQHVVRTDPLLILLNHATDLLEVVVLVHVC